MRKLCAAGYLLMLLGTAGGQAAAPRRDVSDDIVWTWSSKCSAVHQLGIEMRLKSKIIYRGALAVCRGNRQAEDGTAEFYFPGGHTFQGEYRTRPTQKIEGNIWQAGGESDAIILGISFATKDRILLNTVFIAKPDTEASSEIDKDIVVRSFRLLRQHG
jgi:hypothetical protein